jgi:hypothetical protein
VTELTDNNNACNIMAERGKIQVATSSVGCVDRFLKSNHGHEHNKNYRVFSPTRQTFVCIKEEAVTFKSLSKAAAPLSDILISFCEGVPGQMAG